ncbi:MULTISPECIES: radical SAM/SPASM domain-containing protein [Photorhabdus]|uniref:Radical SAM protein n=1 Tax=Photorhabdus kayaii TaxID=230088 RepID=A0ABX0B4I8_9GAMM|nr:MULTISPECIES: SPASM domain-containing protein [Photorhabdus]MCC8375225.1 SPASM domain-containing protein [Photorhabdus bodei]MCC8465247.1 SPASM domain-containing protein [Photorhabdus bodei]MCT8354294.1 SPASM domain-containing protein [Photorhabdus kayaii]NDL12001.1 radical SAM protein [Photorhabdus kayaii]NDL25634.1 radical SAM protein [Photorhabdus kayaii]
MFSMVEIEINSRCNRRCVYCPNVIAPRDAPNRMKSEQFERIIDRLEEANFTGRLSYHFYNEPLLHPKLPQFVAWVTERLPEVRQILYSNGDYLTDEKYQLLHKNGIKQFIITQHDSKPGAPKPDLIWLIPDQLQLTNRAGNVIAGPEIVSNLPCFAPSDMLIITITGNVVLCYEDNKEEVVLGNVFDTPIMGIWNSPQFRRARKALSCGNRNATDICRRCNNRSHQKSEAFDYVL